MTSQFDLIVFLDESGKREKPSLMGGVSIPRNIYERSEFRELKAAIAKTAVHWVSYHGDGKERELIKRALWCLSRFESVIRCNVIQYNQSILEYNASLEFGKSSLADLTIYTKFPERIIYGLLRKYGKHARLTADIIIEAASEYESHHLNEKLLHQLNVQSLYRGERFMINSSTLRPKGREIGLELTDLLLGIIRTIMRNDDVGQSRSKREKTKLILTLLQNLSFYQLVTNIKFYEWSDSHDLREIDFSGYLQSFLAKHHELWLQPPTHADPSPSPLP